MSEPRKTPNQADPLSEPTLNRRLWAAYLHRRLTRASFARKLGVEYKTVDDWDLGKRIPQLDALMKAAVLLDFSLDELCFGRRQRRPKTPETELTVDQIKRLLRELRATRDQAEALAEHARSAAGQYQSFTRSYVAGFVDAFASQIKKLDKRDAIAAAVDAAIGARLLAEGVAAGAGSLVGPVVDGELADMGAEIMAEHAHELGAERSAKADEPRRLLAVKRKSKSAPRRRRQRA